jgi:hypothetical protein
MSWVNRTHEVTGINIAFSRKKFNGRQQDFDLGLDGRIKERERERKKIKWT